MKITRAGYDQLLRAPSGRIAFTGAAGLGQAASAVTVYTLTGRVELIYFAPPFVSEALVSTINLGTISLGTASQVAYILPATTVGAGTFALNMWWHDGIPLLGFGRDLVTQTNGADLHKGWAISESIIIDCLTQDITDGQLDFNGLWYRPLTAGATLTLGANMTAL